ncbi:MAG: hypothetical protein ACTSU5_06050 [Promethearchaeota archaeon]
MTWTIRATLVLNLLSFLLAGLQYGLQFPALAGDIIGSTLTVTICVDVFVVILQGQTLDYSNPFAVKINRFGYIYLLFIFSGAAGFFLLTVRFPAPGAFVLLEGIYVLGCVLVALTNQYLKGEVGSD